MKILHLTHHNGCAADLEAVWKLLNLSAKLETAFSTQFQDTLGQGNARYNVSAQKARQTWAKYADYFESFEAVIVSDTTPLARIFLENEYKGRLIVWVCNRFDYFDGASNDCGFPDPDYYALINRAARNARVDFISYTPYEHVYARQHRKVNFGRRTVRPLGIVFRPNGESMIPAHIDRSGHFFIPPYHNDTKMMDLQAKCSELGIPAYCGRYGGAKDLGGFKGIIHIPYAWSNFALFEQIQTGSVFFLPSLKFIATFKDNFFWTPPKDLKKIKLSDWYHKDLRDLFVYFDSWEDLKRKVLRTDLEKKREKIGRAAARHTERTLKDWKKILKFAA